jgi:Tfp pilus assembly protein PilO
MLGVFTIAAALYGALFYFGSGQLSELQVIKSEQEQIRGSIAMSKELVAERATWEDQMGERQSMMPVFPADQRMDLHWLSVIESVAARHNFQILRHEPGEEKQEGPIYELPVFVRQWEGSIESLVRFLFDIEREGGMLDVRYLHVRPKDKTIRHGRLDIYCAYRRDS